MEAILLILNVLFLPITIYSFLDHEKDQSVIIALLWTVSSSIISLTYFYSKLIPIPFHILLVALTLIQLGIGWNNKIFQKIDLGLKKKSEEQKKPPTLQLVSYGAFMIAALLYARYHLTFGAWDAIAIWNMKASFLAEPEQYFAFLSPLMQQSHPDYPLLISSWIAAFWDVFQVKSPIVPAMYHYLVLLVLLYSIWKYLRQKHRLIGLITLVILCLDRHFIARTASSYADTSLALIYLLATIELLTKRTHNSRSYLMILGFSIGSALWIKNEAIPFLLFFLIIWFIKQYKSSSQNTWAFLLGVSPFIITLLYFKIQLAPELPLLLKHFSSSENLSTEHLQRIVLIASSTLKTLVYTFPFLVLGLIVMTVAAIKHKTSTILYPSAVLLLCFISYLIVYFFSPYDLEWHLKHSIKRLIHQLYPATLLLSAYMMSIFLNKKEAFIF